MKKKKNRLFKVLFWIFFISFMFIYFSEITGYYEYKNYQKTVMTKDQIEKFEQDVKNGNKVDTNDYIIESSTYNNKLSNAANNISNGISKIVKGGVENTFKIISNVMGG